MWRLLLLLSFPLSLVNAYCARDSQCRANYFCDSGKLRCISKKRSGEHCSLIDGDHECLSGHCTLTGFFEAKCVACTTDNHCKPDRFCQRNACQPRGNIGDVCNLALGGRDCRSRKCGIPLSLCVDCFSDDDCASNQYCFFTVPAVCRFKEKKGKSCSHNNQCSSGICGDCGPKSKKRDAHCKCVNKKYGKRECC